MRGAGHGCSEAPEASLGRRPTGTKVTVKHPFLIVHRSSLIALALGLGPFASLAVRLAPLTFLSAGKASPIIAPAFLEIVPRRRISMTINPTNRRSSPPPPTTQQTSGPASNQAASGPASTQQAGGPAAGQRPSGPASAPPQQRADGFAATGDRRFSTTSSAQPSASPPPTLDRGQAAALRNQAASAELTGFRAASGAGQTTAAAGTLGSGGASQVKQNAAFYKLNDAGLSPGDLQKALKEFDQLPATYQAKLITDTKVSPQDLGKMLVAQSELRSFAADPANRSRMAEVQPWPGARNLVPQEKLNQVFSEEGLSAGTKTEFLNKTLEKLKADPSANVALAMGQVVKESSAKFAGAGPPIPPSEIQKAGGLGRAFGLKNLVDYNLGDAAKEYFRNFAKMQGAKADPSITDAGKRDSALALTGMQMALKAAGGDLGKVMQQSGLPQDKFFKGDLRGANGPAWMFPQSQLPGAVTPEVLRDKLALGEDVLKSGAVVINIPPDKAKDMKLTKPTALDGISLPEWAPTDPKNVWGFTKPTGPGQPASPEGMLQPVNLGNSIDLGKSKVYFQ
jgi:hypothetical protein